MAALTADKRRQWQGTAEENHGPAGVDVLFTGALLCFDTSGNLVAGADTANFNFAGINVKQVDNSAGSAGDLDAEFAHTQVERIAQNGNITAAMRGELVFLVDDATVGLAADVSNNIEVGTVERYESSSHVWVKVRRGYAATTAA